MSFGLSLIERETPLKSWMADYQFILVQTLEHLEDLVTRAIKAPLCAFDLESTGLDTRMFDDGPMDRVVGYSIAFEPKICYYIPIRHSVETTRGKNLPLKETNTLIQKLLLEATIVGHNWLKFDAEMMLSSEGIYIKKFKQGEAITYHDSYVLARLAGYKSAGLKVLSKQLLDKEMIDIKEVVNSGQDIDFGSVSPYEGLIYAASDAICTLEIFLHPSIQLPIEDQKFIYNLERRVLYVVRTLERNKIKLDLEFCKSLDSELLGKIDSLVKRSHLILSDHTGGKLSYFNLDSPQEVSDVLFNIFNMEPKPLQGANGNYTTDDETLGKLADKYELAKVLQEYRTYTKYHRTYIKNMVENVDKKGFLKFQFSSLQTDTGRFASPGGGKKGDGCSGVNIQAIPARYDKSKPNIRKCLRGEEDEVIVAMDWAGVELRVAANMSLEPIWLDRFLKGDGDLHTSTASIIYSKPEDQVTKTERQTGKTFNFQSVYGGGPGALASTIGITMDDAREKQGRFFGRLQTLREFIKRMQNFARKNYYCVTMFGRKRSLEGLYKNPEPKVRAGGDRQAINAPIQGTAADLMKLAMVKIDDYIEENGLRDYVKMVITMHDELCFRIKKSHIDCIPDLENVMKLSSILDKINWKVPLAVDVEVGESWDIQYDFKDMKEYLKEVHNQNSVSYLYSEGQDYDHHLAACDAWKKDKKEKKSAENNSKVSPTLGEISKQDFKKMGSNILAKMEAQLEDNKILEASTLLDSAPLRELPAETKLDVPPSVVSDLENNNNGFDTNSNLTKDLSSEIYSEKEVTKNMGDILILDNLSDPTPSKSYAGSSASADDIDNAFKVLKSASLEDLPLEAHAKLRKSFYAQEAERILSGLPSKDDEGVELFIVVHNPIDEIKRAYMGVIVDTCKGNGKLKFVTTDGEELQKNWFNADVIKAAVMSKAFNL